jgi:hypothetical protein
MSVRFDREAAELALWYHENLKRIPKDNLVKKIEFLEVTCDALIKLALNTALDMKRLEGRDLAQRIWIPPTVVERPTPLIEIMEMRDEYVPIEKD